MVRVRFGDLVVKCKGIIFDKDGTLIDSFAVWPLLAEKRLDLIRRRVETNETTWQYLRRVMGLDSGLQGIDRRSPLVVGSPRDTAAAVATVLWLCAGYSWERGIGIALEAFAAADHELGLEKQAVPFPGVMDTLRSLAGVGLRLAVVTNDTRGRCDKLLQLLGISEYLTAVVGSDEVGRWKPFPDMVRLACRRMALSPQECVVVGDSLLDLEMGRRAGVGWCVGVLTGACRVEDFQIYADAVLPGVSAISFEARGDES